MSWAKLDDRANEHRKQQAAGPEACWLWACGLMYANRQDARDGFIPETMVGLLFLFKKPHRLAAKLVEVGLWIRVDGGYLIHDFSTWNKTREQIENDRAEARERMRAVRSERKTNKVPGSDGVRIEQATEHAAAFGAGSGSDSATTTDSDPTPKAPAPVGGGQIGCPADLELMPEQRATHETALVPGWAIDEITKRFRANWVGGAQPRTLEQWRRSLSTTISKTWNDRNQRPKNPTEQAQQPATKLASEEPRWL